MKWNGKSWLTILFQITLAIIMFSFAREHDLETTIAVGVLLISIDLSEISDRIAYKEDSK